MRAERGAEECIHRDLDLVISGARESTGHALLAEIVVDAVGDRVDAVHARAEVGAFEREQLVRELGMIAQGLLVAEQFQERCLTQQIAVPVLDDEEGREDR